MLSFATEFPLKVGTAGNLLASVSIWLKGSPHRVFNEQQLDDLQQGKTSFIEKGDQSLEVIRLTENGSEAIAAKHVSSDKKMIYTTTVVGRPIDGDLWVSVRTDRASLDPQISLREARKPQLIKIILRDIGGGLDGELWTQDKPHYLTDDDQNMVIRLLNGDSTNHLPVVYISRSFRDEIECNADALARHLGGLAHIVVEPSRSFSRAIQHYTNSKNAYGGAVGVYLPTGQRSLVISSNEDEWTLRREVSEIVRSSLLTRLPFTGLSWIEAEAERSRQNIEQLKRDGSTDLDAYVKEFDQENQGLRNRTNALNDELNKVKSELQNVSLISTSTTLTSGLGKVQEYFDGESNTFLREAIETAMQSSLDGSRRNLVLLEFLATIPKSDEMETRRNNLKRALSTGDDLDVKTERLLRELGFTVTSDGKHHKLTYFSDNRLTFTMAKTSSDRRAGKNLASEVTKRVY